MNEVKLVLRLSRIIRTPKQAIAVFTVCGIGIAVAYAIPADILE